MDQKPLQPKEILEEILNIIQFKDDKEKFMDQFFKNIKLQALLDLANTLPQDKKNGFKSQIASKSDEEKASALVSLFPKDDIDKAVEKSTKEIFSAYISEIESTLSSQQRDEITKYLKQYVPASS
ncbi:MAG: hypothetical protein UU05_C0014G0003 [Candidatus Curtissbacteria bacterium GW2011_GWA1_40_47]|nr:MAG: hypothetical protein UT99_C0011G0003 [Candidatus Curtissbacteria bacterium GW2011_GWA2_40_31]KKR61732.1 MAG: hypothetical protein UU00_C0008G0005 [Microgenomates group bacterium GW2011_GWC1_40_35]KKR65588.1 MAG: hypothetical protein UU05_C0014G0003 [Candidatus Curtissbacteria bacterium GW2011_GWA1_40_47]OGH20922.1 MAG: hypothetical protein A2695_01005 [Candidatus Levybacteria bacterium RIFCSPHIGHO2_01_FULL_40_83]